MNFFLLFLKIWLFIVRFPLKLIDESKSIFSEEDNGFETLEVGRYGALGGSCGNNCAIGRYGSLGGNCGGNGAGAFRDFESCVGGTDVIFLHFLKFV